jgi:hypothetical protein
MTNYDSSNEESDNDQNDNNRFIIYHENNLQNLLDIGDYDSDEEYNEEEERQQLRQQALLDVSQNLICMNCPPFSDNFQPVLPVLRRSHAIRWNEYVRLPCSCCGIMVEITLIY